MGDHRPTLASNPCPHVASGRLGRVGVRHHSPNSPSAPVDLRGGIPCELHRPGQRFVDSVRGVVEGANLPASGSDFKYTRDIRAI